MRKNILILLFYAILPLYVLSGNVMILQADTTNTDTISRTVNMKELVVEASRITQKAGGYTINLIGSDAAKGKKDMNDLLETLPGLTEESGALKILGRTPAAIYVNGTKIGNAEILKNIPPEQVASVSVDWNAGPDEYSNKNGVIRIKLKKDLGFWALLNGNFDYGSKGYDGTSIIPFFSFSTKRMTIYNNATFSNRMRFGDYEETTFNNIGNTQNVSTYGSKSWMKSFNDWLSLSYDIADGHTLALSGLVYYHDDPARRDASNSENAEMPETTSYDMPSYQLNAQAVAIYEWEIDSLGSNLNISADYLRTKQGEELSIKDTYSDGYTSIRNSASRQTTDMLRFRPIWKQAINGKDALTSGVDMRYIELNGHNSSSMNDIKERMKNLSAAFFVSYSHKFNDEIGFDAGIRVQYDDMRTSTNGLQNDYSKWSICPGVRMMFIFDKRHGHSFYMQYSHTADEMPYSVISTYHRYDEANHYTTGNPAIKPSNYENVNLILTLFNKLTLSASYYYTRNGIYFANEVDPDNKNILCSIARNGNHEHDFNLNVEFNHELTKWWTLKAYGRFSLYYGYTPDWDVKGQTSWFVSLNNNFRFGRTWGAGIYAYLDPRQNNKDQIWHTVWEARCNVYKTLLDDKLMISLEAKPYRRERCISTINKFYRSESENKTKGEYINLTIRYTFGGKNLKQRKRANATQKYTTIERPTI